MSRLNFIILILLTVVISSVNAQLSIQDKQDLFDKANGAFAKANLTGNDVQARTRAYNDSILYYKTIIDKGGVKNAKLYYNLGNAYLLNNDIGRAILNYRRAEKLDSSDHNLAKNLSFARSQRRDSFKVTAETKVLKTLFFWHYDFSLKTRFILSLLFFVICCIFITILIIKGRKTKLIIPLVVVIVLFMIMVLSLVIDQFKNASSIYGVIVEDNVNTYQGDGVTYPAAFEQPLNNGTEFELLQDRNNWYQILLPDGTDCWIRSDQADII